MHGVWSVAGMEARRRLPFLQWRTALPMLAVALMAALSWPLVADQGLDPSRDLYLAEAAPDALLRGAADEAGAFRVVEGHGGHFAAGEADLLLVGNDVHFDAGRERSRAAAKAFERALRDWQDGRLAGEEDQEAAFPLAVQVRYIPRVLVADGVETEDTPVPDATSAATTFDPGAAGTEDTSTAAGTGTGADALPLPGQAPAVLDADAAIVRPDEIDPPFPVRSLLLTFAYLVPWTFLGQVLAGSLLDTRLARRGLLLVASPWHGGTLLAGLALPYIGLATAVSILVSWRIGAGLLGFAAMLPVLAVLMAASATVGLLSRSQREMTFLLVAITTGLATFLFLPAMFVQVHPVAFASPVAVVSSAIRAEAVPWSAFLYATLPLALMSLALVAVCVALFREETLFSPLPPVSRLVDAVARLVRRPAGAVLGGVLVVPFAFVLELFILVIAVMLDLTLAFLVFLMGSALIEESLKGLPVYARRQRGSGSLWSGAWVGMGFFIGEKVALFVALVGFGLLPHGEDALWTFGVAGGLLLVVAPLVLHMATATVTASVADRGARAALMAVWGATVLHAGYNALLVLGGGLR